MRKVLVLLFVMALMIVPTTATTVYKVGTFNGSFTNSWGKNSITVYYPSSGGPYPSVVFTGGQMASKSFYTWVGKTLAPQGYVVVIVQVPRLSSSNAQQWADGIKGGITYLQTTGKFSGMISGVFGAAGHSSGADGVLLAASQDSRIRAVVSMAPSSPRSDATMQKVYDATPLIKVPVQIQAGSADLLVDPSDSQRFYPVLNYPKEFVEVTGAGHLSFTDLYWVSTGVSTIKKYTLNWFDYYLKGDASKYTYLFGTEAQKDLSSRKLTVLAF